MTIGLALAGLAIIAAAAHPRGAKSLMGIDGSPEEHLAKFREYLSMAEQDTMPIRFRFALIERAWAEAEWANVPPAEQARAKDLQSQIETMLYSAPAPTPREGAVQILRVSPARSSLVAKTVASPRSPDLRHPPAGWKRRHTYKGNVWLVESLGEGRYQATSSAGAHLVGTGNKVLSTIHGHEMNVYDALKLGKERAVFNPMSPPPGWFL